MRTKAISSIMCPCCGVMLSDMRTSDMKYLCVHCGASWREDKRTIHLAHLRPDQPLPCPHCNAPGVYEATGLVTHRWIFTHAPDCYHGRVGTDTRTVVHDNEVSKWNRRAPCSMCMTQDTFAEGARSKLEKYETAIKEFNRKIANRE